MVEAGTIEQGLAEWLFPELKDSEDEKIRKEVINYLTNELNNIKQLTPRTNQFEDWIAWLEKQGELKPATDFSDLRTWKYIVDTVWTEKEGIGQYLDSSFTEEVAKKLQKRFGNIEQKPADLPKGEDYGIDGLYHAIRILENTLSKVDGYQTDDGILEHKCAINAVKELYEQKPAWSEDDEIKIKSITALLKSPALCAMDGNKGIIDESIKYLKSLKDKVQPQPKQEWSEEDDEMLNLITARLHSHPNIDLEEYSKEYDWLNYRLKSLRPRSRWKPSDEHYELEEFAKIVRGNLTGISKAVQKLFEAKYLQLTGNKMYVGFKD